MGATVGSLLRQSYAGRFSIIVVDDQSTDGTAEPARARRRARRMPRIVSPLFRGADRPSGWTGKLWAMQQGLAHAELRPNRPTFSSSPTPTSFTTRPTRWSGWSRRSLAKDTVLTSLMVKLRCESLAERMLIPAFIFFFQKLYPFAWVNDPANADGRRAAGGCMLVRRKALQAAGGSTPSAARSSTTARSAA